MGVIKSLTRSFIFLILVLLFTSFLSIIFANSFIEKDLGKHIVKNVITQSYLNEAGNIDDQQIRMMINEYCKYNDTIKLDTNSEDIGIIELKCSEVENKSKDEIIDILSEKIVDKIYYKNYTCDVITCLKQKEYTVLYSEKGKRFLSNVEKLILIVFLVLIVLNIFLYDLISEKISMISKLIFVSALPLLIGNYIVTTALKNLYKENINMIDGIIFSKINSFNSILIYLLIFSIILYISSVVISKKEKEEK